MVNGKILIGFCGDGEFFRKGNCFRETEIGLGEDLDAALKETVARLAKYPDMSWATADQYSLCDYDLFVFSDMPKRDDPVLSTAKRLNIPRLLVIAENIFINKRNADRSRYREFNRVFTYEDEAVARFGCEKLDYAVRFPDSFPEGLPFEKRKFACMISSRVKKLRPGLTSYHRLWTIDYYESKHPEQFDLYGIGWDQGRMLCPKNENLCKMIARAGISKFVPVNRHVFSWKGLVDKKIPIISQYKFSYCYENTTSIPGYITEKLFDVLRSGTVPVYLGAPETRAFFPKELYVDRAEFDNDDELYAFLSSMSEYEWMRYRECAREFVMDKNRRFRFSVEHHAQVLSKSIIDEVHRHG